MNPDTAKRIVQLFKENEEQFIGKSTDFLLWVTAERAVEFGLMKRCDVSDVSEALSMEQQPNERKTQ